MQLKDKFENVPAKYRDILYYENGRLRAKCTECTNTRSLRSLSATIITMRIGSFTGMCRQCELNNLARVNVLTPEEVENMDVRFDFDSQRREKGHIVIDKICVDCGDRVTVRSSSVKATLRADGTPQGKCNACAKPGQYISTTGYVMLRLPKHPNATKDGYVPEHRWVKEQQLGRYLERSETVHHIDGNKLNNDPINLQLRQGNHGAGVKYQCLDCGSHNVKNVKLD